MYSPVATCPQTAEEATITARGKVLEAVTEGAAGLRRQAIQVSNWAAAASSADAVWKMYAAAYEADIEQVCPACGCSVRLVELTRPDMARRAQLVQTFEDAVFPINKYSRRKGDIRGGTLYLPGLIKAYCSNWTYKCARSPLHGTAPSALKHTRAGSTWRTSRRADAASTQSPSHSTCPCPCAVWPAHTLARAL
jgi:hypothetical protein